MECDVDLILSTSENRNLPSSKLLEEFGSYGDVAINKNGVLLKQKTPFNDTFHLSYRRRPTLVYKSSTKTIRNTKNSTFYESHVSNLLRSYNNGLLSVVSNKINYYKIKDNRIALIKDYTFDLPVYGVETCCIQHKNVCAVCLPRCVSIMVDHSPFEAIFAKTRPTSAHINEFIGEECLITNVGLHLGLYDIKSQSPISTFEFIDGPSKQWCEAQYFGHPRIALFASHINVGLSDLRINKNIFLLNKKNINKILKTHVVEDNSFLSLAITYSGIFAFDSRMPDSPIVTWSRDFRRPIISDIFCGNKHILCVRDSKRCDVLSLDFFGGTLVDSAKSGYFGEMASVSSVVGMTMIPSDCEFPDILQINCWGDIFSTNCSENISVSHKGYSCDPRLIDCIMSCFIVVITLTCPSKLCGYALDE